MDLHYELRDAALRMENGAFLQEPELLIRAAAELTTLRARIAELEAWKADSLLRWQQAVTLGGQQLERIAELEREKGELAARIEAMEPFVAMGAAHTPGAYGPACRDCGAPMIGVERCQHCGGKH